MKQHTFKVRFKKAGGGTYTKSIKAGTIKEAEVKATELGDWIDMQVENYVDPNYRLDLEYVH